MRKTLLSVALLMGVCAGNAQVFSLEECRQLALQDNKKQQMNAEAVAMAQDRKKEAIANFFPTFSANGAYSYNGLDVHLLPKSLQGEFGTFNAGGEFVWQKNLLTPPEGATILEQRLIEDLNTQLQGTLGPLVNEQYGKLYDALSPNLHHTMVGVVSVNQPIFLGGKLIQMHRIAKSGETIAQFKMEKDRRDIIEQVDEAYWRVLSVQEKVALAQQYHELLQKLSSDVDILVEEGMATKSDQLKVRMKLNEAEEKLGQATDGLILSKMALCQIIGKELDYDIQVDRRQLDDIQLVGKEDAIAESIDRREEVKILEETKRMVSAHKGLAASTLMPNVVATAGYVMTNKYVKDGFDPMRYNGWVNAGVVVNIPIAHASDIYKVKAAKHEERMAEYAVEEVREMLELQITQAKQKVDAAQRKLVRTRASVASAEEVLRMAQESFREGVVGSTDLMAAQTQWMSAKSDALDAAIELRMADLTYKKYTGREM